MIPDTIKKISCMLLDVIRETLAVCDYRDCNEICSDYLIEVNEQCPTVFYNEKYQELWKTLYIICNNIGEQSRTLYLDD